MFMPEAKGSASTPLRPIPKIVVTFVSASCQGQRTHSARTKIVAAFVYASSQGQRTHSAQTNSGHLRLCQQPRAAHALRSDQNSGHLCLCQQPRAAHALRSDQNVPKIVATFVCASSQGQRTHSARTKICKISASADGGPRSRVCARETLRSAPHRH